MELRSAKRRLRVLDRVVVRISLDRLPSHRSQLKFELLDDGEPSALSAAAATRNGAASIETPAVGDQGDQVANEEEAEREDSDCQLGAGKKAKLKPEAAGDVVASPSGSNKKSRRS